MANCPRFCVRHIVWELDALADLAAIFSVAAREIYHKLSREDCPPHGSILHDAFLKGGLNDLLIERLGDSPDVRRRWLDAIRQINSTGHLRGHQEDLRQLCSVYPVTVLTRGTVEEAHAIVHAYGLSTHGIIGRHPHHSNTDEGDWLRELFASLPRTLFLVHQEAASIVSSTPEVIAAVRDANITNAMQTQDDQIDLHPIGFGRSDDVVRRLRDAGATRVISSLSEGWTSYVAVKQLESHSGSPHIGCPEHEHAGPRCLFRIKGL